MRRTAEGLLGIALMATALSCASGKPARPAKDGTATVTSEAAGLRVADDVEARRAQFKPMPLRADLSTLTPGDRQALEHLVAAARVMDELFLRQAWRGNPELQQRVAALSGPHARSARDYFRIMFGPWDRLRDFQPFVGDTPHPKGAGFYPQDMSAEELERVLAQHPDYRQAFTSTTTVIERQPAGIVAVPYSVAYRPFLERAAAELRAAADATGNASLQRFLRSRADAFLSDDYYQSDIDWMDLDSPIEVVIGPYETYEDGLFGYKAAFESFVCVAQPEDSRRLAVFKGELPYLERNLPIPDRFKNPNRGSDSPIRVVDEVFTAGDAKAGVQTLAFNLPNDERVREAKGSKKVLLKNMMHAKYDAILVPIAERVLPVGEARRASFDAYFNHVLFHELSHGLGPGRITVGGRQTEVRLELKDLYSAIEEAKADVVGAFSLYALADKGLVPRATVDTMPWTFTAGLFRSARFGVTEAHGLGTLVQVNALLAAGAIEVTADGRFRPVPERFRPALTELARRLLVLEAEGDYAAAQRLAREAGTVPPAMTRLLGSLGSIPVDVDPVFESAVALR